MRHLRSAFKVLCLLGSSLVFQGCFAGGLAAGYLGQLWGGLAATRATQSAFKEPAPRPGTVGTVAIGSLSDPPTRVTAGSGFEIRDAILPVTTARAAPSGTRYYLSLTTNLPLQADKQLLIESRKAVSEGTVTLTIPDDTVPGLYRLVACPRELLPEDGSVAAAGCLVSSGTVIVEAIRSEPKTADRVQRSFGVRE